MSPVVSPGQVIAGRYRVERIDRERDDVVFASARHLTIEKLVTLVVGYTESGDRFLRDARTAGRIQNPYAAETFDYGQLENGAGYLVLEHLDGEPLSTWLGRQGGVQPELAVRLVT